MRISDWSSDVCSSDLPETALFQRIDQLVADQPRQGLAQGRHSDPVLLDEGFELELAAGQEPSSHDVLADALVGLASKRARRRRRGCGGHGDRMLVGNRKSGGWGKGG